MNWDGVLKSLSEAGSTAVLAIAAILLYRLLDKWGASFLEASRAQTSAMADQASATGALAAAVKEGQQDQREVLMAVRVLADRIERQGEYLASIDAEMRRRTAA